MMLSGPVFTDKLLGRLSVLYDDWDGSYDNSFPGGNDIGGYRYRSLQSRLDWRPAQDWTISASYYRSDDEIDDPAMVPWPANCEDRVDDTPNIPRMQNFCGEIPGIKSAPGLTGNYSIPKVPQITGEKRELDRANLVITWDQSYGTWTALTGYSDTEQSAYSTSVTVSARTFPFSTVTRLQPAASRCPIVLQ